MNTTTIRNRKRHTGRLFAALGAATAVLIAGCGRGGGGEKAAGGGGGGAPGTAAAQEATPVRVIPATRTTVRRTLPVTGSISALQTIDLSPKVAAKVISVVGREGASVRRGQVVVQQDTSDLVTQVQQARANLEAAQARLSQAQTQYRVTSSLNTGEVENARQLLAQAESALALARRPQRTEEVAVAENAVRQAQANLEAVNDSAVRQARASYDKAVVDRQRYERLVKEGAAAQSVLEQYATQEQIAKAALDAAQEQYAAQRKVAQAALNSAQQQLDIARTGGRVENVQTAQSNVARARLGVRSARTNLQQIQARRDDIEAARAAVSQARAALAFAQQQVANAAIRSPIDGVISDRLTEPGQQAAPGQGVVRIVGLGNVFFEAQVPETDIRSVRTGMVTPVRIDALPGRVFTGRVAKVYPTANTQSRNFVVRVVIPNSGGLLRPGLFARGEVVAESRQGTVVAKDAILSREGKTLLFVAGDDKKAVLRTVRVGIQTPETVEIVSGVKPGERVIVAGQDTLSDGSTISVQGETGGGTRQAVSAAR